MGCQTCKHYHYHCGVGKRLQAIIGRPMPSRPVNYCDFANVIWERKKTEITKPKGISCNFEAKEMTCTECGKVAARKTVWLTLIKDTCICNSCGKKIKERESQSKKEEAK
jgi:hypothetical protein